MEVSIVRKTCSIMEAVANLNSSSSDQSYGKQQDNVQKKYGGSASEEPQESAGSNSYVGQQQPWHGRNSVYSTERNCVAGGGGGNLVEEEVEESTNGGRWKRGGGGGLSGSSRVSGTSASSRNKNRVAAAGVRKDYLLPVEAAAAASS